MVGFARLFRPMYAVANMGHPSWELRVLETNRPGNDLSWGAGAGVCPLFDFEQAIPVMDRV